MAEKKIVGFRKGINSKTQNPTTTIYTLEEFNQYENGNGCIGQKAKETYCSFDVPEIKVGQSCIVEMEEGFQGKAIVVGVTLIPFK